MRQLCQHCGGRGFWEANPLETPLEDTDFDTRDVNTALPIAELLRLADDPSKLASAPPPPPVTPAARGEARVQSRPGGGWRVRLSRILG